jgi:hypothetical protein
MCFTVDQEPTACVSGAAPGRKIATTTAHSHWTVTLASVNESSPTVDVAFSWPSNNPAITLTHGRFEGYPSPDSLRGLTATFRARTAGQLLFDATWPPATANATLTLTDVSGSQPVAVDSVSYQGQGSVSPTYTHAVRPGETYQLTLINNSAAGVRPSLTATIQFP